MNKLSTTLTRLRSWSKDGSSDLKVGAECGQTYSKPEMKSPEFQRRAARAMGQMTVPWFE